MLIVINSTDTVTEVDGVKVRVWSGMTAGGAKCYVLVHRVMVQEGEDSSEFDRDLAEQAKPTNAERVEADVEGRSS